MNYLHGMGGGGGGGEVGGHTGAYMFAHRGQDQTH